MGRLIDADLLYKAMQDAEELARRRVRDTDSTLPYPNNLNPSYTRYLAQMDERTKAKHMIADAPTVDAALVKHGRWIKKRYWIEGAGMGERYGYYYSCSKCGNLVCGGYDECGKKYCDECGARMDGKDGGNVQDKKS